MRLLARVLLALGAIAASLVITAGPAAAHPLGNFTVNRYTGILVSPTGVQVDHVVDLAEIPTAQLGRRDRRPARPWPGASAPRPAAGSSCGRTAPPYA